MGAWGNGPFENDDALDFVGDLEDSDDLLADDLARVFARTAPARPAGTLAKLFRCKPDGDGYLDVTEGSQAVAAAALVAAALGLDVADAQAAELLAAKHLEVSAGLRAAARTALDRVGGPDSEWSELWEEAGELPSMLAALDRIRSVL